MLDSLIGHHGWYDGGMKNNSLPAAPTSLRFRRSGRRSPRSSAAAQVAATGADVRVFHVVFRLPAAPAAEAESAWSLAEAARRHAPDLAQQFMEMFFKVAAPHYERAFELQVSEGAHVLLGAGAPMVEGVIPPVRAA